MPREDAMHLARLNFLYNSIFDRPIDMSTFERRMQLQKLIYILQSEGVNLGYNFTWYLRGPYSSLLADDGYAFVKSKGEIDTSYTPTRQEQTAVDKLVRAGVLIQDPINAELIASHLYLEKRYARGASEELKTRKPRFTLPHIAATMQAWSQIH